MKASRIFRRNLGKSVFHTVYLRLESEIVVCFFLSVTNFLKYFLPKLNVLVCSSSFYHKCRMPFSQWKLTFPSYFPINDSGSFLGRLISSLSLYL